VQDERATAKNKEGAMTAANYSLLVALIFALAAIAQIIRAAMGVPVTVGQTSIPVWVSWVACVVAAILAWLGFSAFRG
jgi:protein-S-isoprenylcysteine O-methyltransferase Ste14